MTKALDKSKDGNSPSHANNLSKLMAKLDDQSASAVYGTGGLSSLPNVNPYQNTNTVHNTQQNITAGGTFSLNLNSLLNDSSSRVNKQV